MIDISLYRCRIGRFSQKVLKIKLPKYILESQKLNKKSKQGVQLFYKTCEIITPHINYIPHLGQFWPESKLSWRKTEP